MTGVVEQTEPERVLAGSLSPSRASDFKTCPLLYRFRSIDRIPQKPTTDKARGTLVHAVLDRLFDLPAGARTYEAAAALVEPEWAAMAAAEPETAELFAAGGLPEWLDSARRMVAGYFALEDPSRLEPAAREQLVEAVLDLGESPGLALRGYVDRLDVAPTGEVRVVDYKTGAIPRMAYEAKALFQLKFYALVLWRTQGTVPHTLKLMYLSDRDTLAYRPDAEELERFERTLVAVWRAIERAVTTRDFRANPSRLCGWCDYQALCPAQGGTLPPYPEPTPAADAVEPAAGITPAADAVGPAADVTAAVVAAPTG
ncbi:MAG TPA: PD-(D/E)XK nuclease family protein [Mycobacteriales bacterium]|jgi:putative RecB family exonuclease|nr:PD-(D/E)XK nuclease family protein [Mycobacteriales bacterium]